MLDSPSPTGSTLQDFIKQQLRADGIWRLSNVVKPVLTQQIYPARNDNETYTYTYYSCLYAPCRNMTGRLNFVR
jgi:hypothetical protein